MLRRLLRLLPVVLCLSACGNCQGHVTNSGPSRGSCTLLSVGL